MLDGLKDLVREGGSGADALFTSDDEVNEQLTERLRIDLTSPYKLPHLIRPMSTIYSGIIWGISIIWALIISSVMINKIGLEAATKALLDPSSLMMYVLAATTANYGTHIGFYFQSRKNEKIAFKNADANIEIKKMEIKHEAKKRDAMLEQEIKDMELKRKIELKKNGVGLFRKRKNE